MRYLNYKFSLSVEGLRLILLGQGLIEGIVDWVYGCCEGFILLSLCF